MASQEVLDRRALGRATLARQLLLERAAVPVVEAVERVMGLQAQLARPPFVGLWSRVAGFRRADLIAEVLSHRVVRATMMRCTIHLVSGRDYLALRGTLQPMLTASMTAVLKQRAAALDMPRVLDAARALLAEGPQTFEVIRAHLLARLGGDDRALGYAVRTTLPLVMAPTAEDRWGFHGSARFALAEDRLGRPHDQAASPHALVLRYLAAFGPATIADAQRWSGLRGLGPVMTELRPQLITLRDERGRELFDLPDAPRPGADAPAPVRFLPDYDSLVLAHDDRLRLIDDAHRPLLSPTKNLVIQPTFLIDGRVAGVWKADTRRKVAMIVARPFVALASKTRRELEAEGDRLLAFLEPDAASREVVFEAPFG
jgi:hypothetical protein